MQAYRPAQRPRPDRSALRSETTFVALSFGRRLLEYAGLGLCVRDQLSITRLVLSRHADGSEALLKPGSNCPAVETGQLADSANGVFLTIDNEARHAVLYHFRYGA